MDNLSKELKMKNTFTILAENFENNNLNFFINIRENVNKEFKRKHDRLMNISFNFKFRKGIEKKEKYNGLFEKIIRPISSKINAIDFIVCTLQNKTSHTEQIVNETLSILAK